MLRRRRSRAIEFDGSVDVPGSGVAIYEVQGRLLIRTMDGSGGLGIERLDAATIDGYPDVDTELLGQTVIDALESAREIPRPSSWTEMSDHTNRRAAGSNRPANPLVAASPGTYRSFRAWQRVARRVSVARTSESWTTVIWGAELSSGGWLPASGQEADEILSGQRRVPRDATPAEVGEMVMHLLTYPPIADG